jgi:hypothetical protein
MPGVTTPGTTNYSVDLSWRPNLLLREAMVRCCRTDPSGSEARTTPPRSQLGWFSPSVWPLKGRANGRCDLGW